jgi:hypothetical protein
MDDDGPANRFWPRCWAVLWLLEPTWPTALLSIPLYLILTAPQSGEALFAAANPASEYGGPLVAVYLGTLLLAVSSWYGTRVLLNMDYRRAGGEPRVPRTQAESSSGRAYRSGVPRLLGLLPFAAVAIGFAKAAEWQHVAGFVAGGALFFSFLVWRRRRVLGQEPVAWSERLPRESALAAGMVVGANAAVFVWLWRDPVRGAQLIGTGGVVLLGFAGWIACASVLVHLGYGFCYRHWWPRLTPFAALFAAVVAAGAFSPSNHPIRRAECETRGSCARWDEIRDEEDVKQHFPAWLDARRTEGELTPVVLVSAEGGGMRAAYWTASILGHLSEQIPGFACHVYAVSGASGGSVGAGIWLALLAERLGPDPGAGCERYPKDAKDPSELDLVEPARRMFERDLLAPVIGGLLTRDLLGYFLPGIWEDRAAVFERALEDAWTHRGRRVAPVSAVSLEQDFLALWGTDRFHTALPSLLVNTSRQETGGPATVSNLSWTTDALDSFDRVDRSFGLELYPLMRRLDHAIAISTALHLGARFPVVSPAATVWCPEQEPGERDVDCHERAGAEWDRIADGGYFENSGAFAALELKRHLLRMCSGRCVFFHIAITNDPLHPEVIREMCGEEEIESKRDLAMRIGCPTKERRLGFILNPVKTFLLGATAWRTISEHRFVLLGESEQHDTCTHRFWLRLKPRVEYQDPALGWLLDDRSRENMDKQARDLGDAVDVLQRAFAERGCPGRGRPLTAS